MFLDWFFWNDLAWIWCPRHYDNGTIEVIWIVWYRMVIFSQWLSVMSFVWLLSVLLSYFYLQVFLKWLLTVKKNYRSVAYHNWRHAFNVTQTMFTMILASRFHCAFLCLLLIIIYYSLILFNLFATLASYYWPSLGKHQLSRS